MSLHGFCRCSQPAWGTDADSVTYCERCGELLPSPIEVAMPQLLRTVAQLKRQIDTLVARLPETPTPASGNRLIDVATVAAEYGLTPEYIYRYSDRLGAIRLSGGPRPRLHFRRDRIEQALTAAPPASSNEPVRRTHRKTSTKTHD